MNFYKKVFICEINNSSKDTMTDSAVAKALMKTYISGVITGIQKYSRKTVYFVDDGTGTVECVLWHTHDESFSSDRMNRFTKELDSFNNENSNDVNDLDNTCEMLLNKMHVNDENTDYHHGDFISCLGIVKQIRNKLQLNINHHYKNDNINAETLWILNVMSCLQDQKR